MPALTPEQVARSAFDKWHEENDHLLDTYNFVDDCMFSAYQAGGAFALQQAVPDGYVSHFGAKGIANFTGDLLSITMRSKRDSRYAVPVFLSLGAAPGEPGQ